MRMINFNPLIYLFLAGRKFRPSVPFQLSAHTLKGFSPLCIRKCILIVAFFGPRKLHPGYGHLCGLSCGVLSRIALFSCCFCSRCLPRLPPFCCPFPSLSRPFFSRRLSLSSSPWSLAFSSSIDPMHGRLITSSNWSAQYGHSEPFNPSISFSRPSKNAFFAWKLKMEIRKEMERNFHEIRSKFSKFLWATLTVILWLKSAKHFAIAENAIFLSARTVWFFQFGLKNFCVQDRILVAGPTLFSPIEDPSLFEASSIEDPPPPTSFRIIWNIVNRY